MGLNRTLSNFKPESAVENYQECVEQERLNPWQFPSFRLSICKFTNTKNQETIKEKKNKENRERK